MALEWHQSRTGSLFVMAAVSFPYLNEFHRILYQSQRLGLGLRKHVRHGLRILEGRPQQGNNRRFFFCVLISSRSSCSASSFLASILPCFFR